jgi:hypothetical protein
VAILLAVCAAVANALATVLQRLGVEQAATSEGSSRKLMAGVLRRPIWFAGLALTTMSFLLQAIALAWSNLSTVQPIMVTEIVFLVAILGIWTRRRLGWREWTGACGTAIALGAFLAISDSTGGSERPSASDWLLLLIAAGGAVILGALGGLRGARSWRAACFGVAAGITYALTAAFIKTVADQWPHGTIYVFTHLEAYGVAITGLAGLVLSQHALNAGPVAASQSSLLIVNPLSSIVMGIWLFGDRINARGPRAVFEVLFLVLMSISLAILAHSPLVTSNERDEQLTRPTVGLQTSEART